MTDAKSTKAAFFAGMAVFILASVAWAGMFAALFWGFGLEVKSWGWLVGGYAAFVILRAANAVIVKEAGLKL